MSFCKFSTEYIASSKTELDNIFINDYLPFAQPKYVSVYIYGLYLCSSNAFDNSLLNISRTLNMSEEEILRSSGLILTDPDTGKEGITLAAILLFGKDNTIMSVLPQYKTDAIYRVKNIDRYDDREVIITEKLLSQILLTVIEN